MNIKPGQKYHHFKGYTMEIITLARHSETKEEMVVYKHLDDNTIWVRPRKMFEEKLDKNKYPNATQEYRFELIKENM